MSKPVKKIIFWIFVPFFLCLLIAAGFYIKYRMIDGKNRPSEIQKEITKEDIDNYVNDRAEIIYKKKYYKTIIATYERVLALAPDDVSTKKKISNLYLEIAKLEIETGNKDVAKKEVESSLKFDPENEDAKQLLDELKLK